MENSIAGRMNFDIAVQLFRNAFKRNDPNFDPIQAFRMTQSRLRLEQPIVTTSTLYNFPVLSNIQNQAQAFSTEVRLKMQDTFLPTHVAVYVAKAESSSVNDSAFKLQSYLNPFIFTNAAAMLPIYNGVMNLTVNNDIYLRSWPLWWHWNSPQTQATAAPGAGSPVDQFEGGEYALKPMQPFVLLSGASDIVLNINLPAVPTAVDANSRLIVIFDGILAQTSTVVQ